MSCQYLNSCLKVDNTSGNMMFSICCCVRFFDSFIYSSEEIRIHPTSGTLLYLRNSLETIIVLTTNNLILHLMLSLSLVFTYTSSTISLCTSVHSIYLERKVVPVHICQLYRENDTRCLWAFETEISRSSGFSSSISFCHLKTKFDPPLRRIYGVYVPPSNEIRTQFTAVDLNWTNLSSRCFEPDFMSVCAS